MKRPSIAETTGMGLSALTCSHRPHLRTTNRSWRVDETYIRVKGKRAYLYRALDAAGQTIAFLLPARRDVAAARRFCRRALKQPHTVNPRTITVDKNAAK